MGSKSERTRRLQGAILLLVCAGLAEHLTVGLSLAESGQQLHKDTGEVIFSHQRGLFTEPFELELSGQTPAAAIHYTTDGNVPDETAGGRTILYGNPIVITTTTCIRARVVGTGETTNPVYTHTYLFIDDVIKQPADPTGFPHNWGHAGDGDYEMDPEVTDNPPYHDRMIDAMTSLSSLSLVMDIGDWFGPDGIYIAGELDERAVSAELLSPDNAEGFQIDCGVMIVGGTSTERWKSDKLSMRLKFKKIYGPAKLEYPLFGEEAPDEFDTIVLDSRINNAWAYGGIVAVKGRALNQRDIAQYTRDRFASDIQTAMGGLAPHSKPVHLYINGLYWGLYIAHERPDEHFAATYLGGSAEDYDIIKHQRDGLVSGSNDSYLKMVGLADLDLSAGSRFEALTRVLDIDGFVDYIILNFYLGNTDWAYKNWYASFNRARPDGRWRFHSWDAEHIIESLEADITHISDDGAPTGLHHRMSLNAQYRRLFGDRVYRHFFNNGILTPDRLKKLYDEKLAEIDPSVIAESARWGDNRREPPYTRDVEWITERNWIRDTYLADRTNIVLSQLQAQGLFAEVEAPAFPVNGNVQTEVAISRSDVISMTAPSGNVYYTLDGTDPALTNDAISPTAIEYATPFTLSETTQIKARALHRQEWSALHMATFVLPESITELRITELHYHPLPAESVDDREFEFIELKNTGDSSLNLTLACFTNGIDYIFPAGTRLSAGEHAVIASNRESFFHRYGFKPLGEYSGHLDNAGERLILVSAAGDTVLALRYDDKYPWPVSADGDGFSLVSDVANPTGDPGLPEYWKSSFHIHGSPGADDGHITGGIEEFQLMQNYPNPFNSATEISYHLSEASFITLRIYNLSGQEITTLMDKHQNAGYYSVRWDAESHASGTYFCKMSAVQDDIPAYEETRTLVLLK